ncbi:MAG: S16 family serine protease [Promethearchaeota archaeon]
MAPGNLGDATKESVQNVSALIKKHIGINISKRDIHIQFLQSAVKNEGPSASITIATAIVSALTNVPIRQNVAMTGSLSVRGEVLPIGGATFKTEGAIAAGIKKIIVPRGNYNDIVLGKGHEGMIEVIPVQQFWEVLEIALVEEGRYIVEQFKGKRVDFDRQLLEKLFSKRPPFFFFDGNKKSGN